MDKDSFIVGGFYAGVSVAIIAYLLNALRRALLETGLKNRPYDAFADAAQPRLTASGVVHNSNLAGVRVVVLTLGLIPQRAEAGAEVEGREIGRLGEDRGGEGDLHDDQEGDEEEHQQPGIGDRQHQPARPTCLLLRSPGHSQAAAIGSARRRRRATR